ncbi:MAG: aspartyl protease family protein, partial [Saprospiraceae bacterium]|nr:aspartyl protease family protein [Saprospiraceae bacterium]
KLDFKRKELTLFSRSKPILTNGYSRLPLTLAKSKPYLNLSVKIKGDSSRNLKLLFDTGAGLPLLIIHNTLDSNLMPSSVITGRLGMGLGGFIEGTIGKINSFSIGEFTLHNVVTSFQFLDSKLDSISLLQKNGIIGNDIIRLFDWYLDYGNEFCYFKPNKDYKKAPVYDMSGMVLMAYGEDLNNYEVIDITKGSAAFYQDIRQGDVIKSVNRWPRYLLSYQKIVKILSNKEGDDVRIILKRGEKTLKKHIRLKNIL